MRQPEDDLRWLREERDRYAIRQTFLRYFWGADRGDVNLHESAFAPDARLFIDGVQRRGAGAPPRSLQPDPRGISMSSIVATTHHLHRSDIRFEGDEALAESYATAHVLIEEQGRRRVLVRGLRYLDRLVRQGDDWLIAERHHNLDWMYSAVDWG